jgi:hypothetical protein
MILTRLLVVAMLMVCLCGCEALKHDKILGDDPWQPGGFKSVKDS